MKVLFCNFSLITVWLCNFFGAKIAAQKLLVKCWWTWLQVSISPPFYEQFFRTKFLWEAFKCWVCILLRKMKSASKMLVKFTPDVNFINILGAHFAPIFWRQKYKSWNVTIGRKLLNLIWYKRCERKMLMKLTTGFKLTLLGRRIQLMPLSSASEKPTQVLLQRNSKKLWQKEYFRTTFAGVYIPKKFETANTKTAILSEHLQKKFHHLRFCPVFWPANSQNRECVVRVNEDHLYTARHLLGSLWANLKWRH